MNSYDVIVIGTGAGGGALAQRLAPGGKRILILERGTFLPQEKENWNTEAVFIENRYHTDEVWQDSEGKPLHPQTAYWVGGNTKVYGAALFRLRERDFEEVRHEDGISPEWPLKYSRLPVLLRRGRGPLRGAWRARGRSDRAAKRSALSASSGE